MTQRKPTTPKTTTLKTARKLGSDEQLLHELIVATTAANVSVKESLSKLAGAMEKLATNQEATHEFVQEIRTEKKAFYKYAARLSLIVHLVELAIIITLLNAVKQDGGAGAFGILTSILKLL